MAFARGGPFVFQIPGTKSQIYKPLPDTSTSANTLLAFLAILSSNLGFDIKVFISSDFECAFKVIANMIPAKCKTLLNACTVSLTVARSGAPCLAFGYGILVFFNQDGFALSIDGVKSGLFGHTADYHTQLANVICKHLQQIDAKAFPALSPAQPPTVAAKVSSGNPFASLLVEEATVVPTLVPTLVPTVSSVSSTIGQTQATGPWTIVGQNHHVQKGASRLPENRRPVVSWSPQPVQKTTAQLEKELEIIKKQLFDSRLRDAAVAAKDAAVAAQQAKDKHMADCDAEYEKSLLTAAAVPVAVATSVDASVPVAVATQANTWGASE